MKSKQRRLISKNELGVISASLRPIRTFEQVGRMMGISPTTVFELENSALRKIILALDARPRNGRPRN